MNDDPNTPPWARRSGFGTDRPAPSGDAPGGSSGGSAAGSSGPGGRDWLSKPGDGSSTQTVADARSPWQGSPPPGPGRQRPPSGGSGDGRGPLIAVGAVVVVLLLVAVGLLTALLVGGDDEKTIVERPQPAPTATAPAPTANVPPTTGGTTTSSTTTGPRSEAPSSGATAKALNGGFTVDVPGGWSYQATSASSGGEIVRPHRPHRSR